MRMEKSLKIKLSLYLLISSVSFTGLILTPQAGISVLVFVLIQFICLLFLMPKREPLVLMIPVFILSLNPLISGSTLWQIPNFFVALGLLSLMALMTNDDWELGESAGFVLEAGRNIFRPFVFFKVPVQWVRESRQGDGRLLKRIFKGIAISIPCLILIVALLASADGIFLRRLIHLLISSQSWSPSALFKWIGGLAAGFYLFGLLVFHPSAPGGGRGRP